MAALHDYVYSRDFMDRVPLNAGPLSVRVAAHLEQHQQLAEVEPLLCALREGHDLSLHISPMRGAKKAFKRATRDGDWSRYAKMMDSLLNKWGIFHFHAANGRILVFVYFCLNSSTAYVIEIRNHSDNWEIERSLVCIVVQNWPDAGMARGVATGSSNLKEVDLLKARRKGLNMPVEVAGKFYLPSHRGLMTDGSRYAAMTGIAPIMVTAKRFDPTSANDEGIRSPQIMMVGVDPGDPRPAYMVGAAEAGALAARRHEALARKAAQDREIFLRNAVLTVLGWSKK